MRHWIQAGRISTSPLRCAALALGLTVAPLALTIAPHPAAAQSAPAPQPVATTEDRLTQAQLEQILAPIALYPDDLLMQVLMASTYPLEIVQAKRWLDEGQNAALAGDALVQALTAEPWDPSVKSLLPFPDVLTLLNTQLDWTQQVGDAVLGQQDDVLNAVQVLRGRAQANGALQSGPQQTVNVTQTVNAAPAQGSVVQPPPQTITIAPTNPEQIYVPAYNPTVVYGSWPYAEYPPAYYPPPASWGVGNALLTGMAFAGGVAAVNSLWGWASPSWGRGNIDVNVNRFNNINVNRNQITGNRWQHDVSHRHGVAYRNTDVRNRYRGADASSNRVQSREQFRGRVNQAERGGGIAAQRPDGNRPNRGDRRPAGNRPNAGAHAGAHRAAAQHRPSGRPQARPAAAQRGPQALQGAHQGGRERAAAQRGHASRQGQPAARARAQNRAAAHPAGGRGGHRGGGGGGAHRGGRHR